MTPPASRAAVVVLNWNGLDLLAPCLDSVLRSDHPDFFVVVVDNGSTDGSVAYLRGRGDVEVVALADNRRFAEGNNAGAARAIGLGATFLLILNNDTTIQPDALRRLADAARGGGMAAPRIVFADDRRRIWYGGGRFDPWTGLVAHRAIRRPIDAGADPAGQTGWVTGCALAIEADLWQRLGGLDPAFYIYSEDVDLCLRAREAGARIAYCPEAVVHHAVSASVGGGSSPFKAYHRTRARRQLMRRHGRGPFWPVGLWLQEAAWAALRWASGHGDAARAVFDAMREPADAPPGYRVEDQFPDRGESESHR